jgi:hypothetical protein
VVRRTTQKRIRTKNVETEEIKNTRLGYSVEGNINGSNRSHEESFMDNDNISENTPGSLL